MLGGRFARLLIALGVGAGLLFAAAQSHARWKPEYAAQPAAVQDWVRQQHNSRGEWCCDESDGHEFLGSYTLNSDGSVSVGDELIPKEYVLTGPNPTGRVIWWYRDMAGGGKRTYCFALGTLS